MAGADFKEQGELHLIPGTADVYQLRGRNQFLRGYGSIRHDHADSADAVFNLPEIYY